MSKYKLIKIYEYKDEEFSDESRPIKGILTDFVNDNLIYNNDNELKLLDLIYTEVDKVLNKYKLTLIFKGGNTMRLISNNIMNYFPPNSDKIINDVFSNFLKFSDNDFTIFINPSIRNYETIYEKVNFELLDALNKIRDKIIKDRSYYFYIYKLNDSEIKKLKCKLLCELNKLCFDKNTKSLCKRGVFKNVKLSETTDKMILFENEKDRKSNVLIFENPKPKYEFFNSLNFTLDFVDTFNNRTKFSLLRTKVNFLLNCKDNFAGELIDISIPHKDDFEMKALNNTKIFDKYMKKKIVKAYNEKYKFEYHIINIAYIIPDLYKILFISNKYPWDDKKYKKRLARLVYFIFLSYVDDNKISIETLLNVKDEFINFLNALKNGKNNVNFDHLNTLLFAVKEIKKISDNQVEKYNEFINNIIDFSTDIIKIINEIVKYQSGMSRLENIYGLDDVK